MLCYYYYFFFFFNDTATTEIYTLSLHDALPISPRAAQVRRARHGRRRGPRGGGQCGGGRLAGRVRVEHAQLRADDVHRHQDRKSTRLNSSHGYISYAVFCFKKKKKHRENFVVSQ